MRRREFIALLSGAAATWPLGGRAQQPAIPVIGYLSSRSPDESRHLVEAFRMGLAAGGYVEGQNVAIEYRWGEGQYGRLPVRASELVSRGVAVVVRTGGEPSVLAAKAATSAIPIVFTVGGDPVKLGLVASLNRPGGNATGVSLLTTAPEAKRLGLLKELVPDATVFGVLINPNYQEAEAQSREVQEAGRAIGRRVQIANAGSDQELGTAFAGLVEQRAGALLVAADPFFDTRRDRIVALAAQFKLPAIYQFRDYAVVGGLMSYGSDIASAFREVGLYTARILKGEKPADLPVLQSTKFELAINLSTARTLGVAIPTSLLALADLVVE